MKSLISAFVGCLLGMAIGYEIASRIFFPKLVADLRLAELKISSEQRYAAIVSVAALTKLEAGETDKVKSFLAGEIASYAKHNFDSSFTQDQKIACFIQAAAEKSATLKEELAKEHK